MSNMDLERPQSFRQFFLRLFASHWQALSLLLLGVCVPLFFFEQLASVIYRQGGFPWDEAILRAIHTTAQPSLDRIALTITPFGYWGVIPVTSVISLVLLYRQRWRSLTYILITMVGSTFINRTAKLLFHRTRPSFWDAFSHPSGFAFPSGHAMASMSLVSALVILTWGTRWCWLVVLFGSVFVGTIAWTRLYLGVHFPSDILAGWMVSLAWTIGVSLVIRPHLTGKTLPQKETLLSSEEVQAVN